MCLKNIGGTLIKKFIKILIDRIYLIFYEWEYDDLYPGWYSNELLYHIICMIGNRMLPNTTQYYFKGSFIIQITRYLKRANIYYNNCNNNVI